MKISKRIISLLVGLSLAVLAVSCDNTKSFSVSGSVAGGANKTLYLEYLSLTGTEVLDSVKLDSNGRFKFEQPVPVYPDFYRLRLDKQVIPFCIDKESDLHVTADAQSFATSYSIEGEIEASQVREVWLAQLDANVTLSKLEAAYKDGSISLEDFVQKRDDIIDTYKEIARKYIYNDPASPVAYFALFQQVDGNLVFNLYDKEDSKAFAAVANVYNTYYPESARTKHLYDLALRSIAVVREQDRRAKRLEMLAEERATEPHEDLKVVSYIDIELPNKSGNMLRLSDTANRKVTLLSLTTMTANWSSSFNAQLAQVYGAYQPRGLEIFQVGLDSDPHIWRSSIEGLPWINVQDRDGGFSKLVGMYNVHALPALFLIYDQGEEIERIDTLEQLIKLLDEKI